MRGAPTSPCPSNCPTPSPEPRTGDAARSVHARKRARTESLRKLLEHEAPLHLELEPSAPGRGDAGADDDGHAAFDQRAQRLVEEDGHRMAHSLRHAEPAGKAGVVKIRNPPGKTWRSRFRRKRIFRVNPPSRARPLPS